MRIADLTRARITIVLAAAVLGAGTAGLIACGEDEQATTTVTEQAAPPTTSSTSSTTDDTTTGETTTTGGDVSGNCDEAEHADDPECSGGIEADDDNSGSGSSGSGGSGPG